MAGRVERSARRTVRTRRPARSVPVPIPVSIPLPERAVVRTSTGLTTLESTLRRHGFPLVAGVDEAGRGACAGPLVVAACVLPEGRRGQVPDLADSKLLTAPVRERVYAEVVTRAVASAVIVISAQEVDARGLHVCNVEGMRRAVAGLTPRPSYALTDGFPVPGLGMPTLAVWKGDRVSACVAAASVLAKVTRDRIMTRMHEDYPDYDFATHKGYVTRGHEAALHRHGPCPQHRRSYVNVARATLLDADVEGDSNDDCRAATSAATSAATRRWATM